MRYLLSVYQPDGPVPEPDALSAIGRALDTLNAAMRAAGVLVSADGLQPPSTASVVRPIEGGAVVTDGPYLQGDEHLGGFTVVDVADREAALEWSRRLAIATTLPIEVRPFA